MAQTKRRKQHDTPNPAHLAVRSGAGRPGSNPFRSLDRAFALFCAALGRSFAGRLLTSYRRGSTALLPGLPDAGAGAFRPLSRLRSRAAAAVERSVIIRALSTLFSLLADCPVRVYGLFFMVYSLVGITVQAVGPMVWSHIVMSSDSLILFFTVLIVSAPLTLTSKSLARAFGSSWLGRGLLCGMLGVPEKRLDETDSRSYTPAYYIFITAAVLCGLGTIVMPPSLPLWFMLGFGLVGLILSVPEAGVSLSCLLLPLCRFGKAGLHAAVAVILLTWVGYVVHALSLHYTFRLGRLDGIVAVLGIVMTLNAFLSPSDWQTGLVFVVLLSDYLLVINLMNTRAAIRRCLAGVVLTLLPVLLLGAARRMPADLFLWMDSRWLGARFADAFAAATDTLRALPYRPLLVLLTLLFPWSAAFLFNSRRPLDVFFRLLLAAGSVLLLCVDGTPFHLAAVLVGFLVFCLFYSHTTLTVTACALPFLAGGGIAAWQLLPVAERIAPLLDELRVRWAESNALWPDVWRLILRRPAGVGLGETAFRDAMNGVLPGAPTTAGNAFLDVFAALGWAGMAVILLMAVLFLQKGLSCLSVCRAPRDRAWIAAGLATFFSLLGVGMLHSFGPDPALFFTLVLLLGLCSAHQTIIFNEQNLLLVREPGSAVSEDAAFRLRV